jgi:hypothetical protein
VSTARSLLGERPSLVPSVPMTCVRLFFPREAFEGLAPFRPGRHFFEQGEKASKSLP